MFCYAQNRALTSWISWRSQRRDFSGVAPIQKLDILWFLRHSCTPFVFVFLFFLYHGKFKRGGVTPSFDFVMPYTFRSCGKFIGDSLLLEYKSDLKGRTWFNLPASKKNWHTVFLLVKLALVSIHAWNFSYDRYSVFVSIGLMTFLLQLF